MEPPAPCSVPGGGMCEADKGAVSTPCNTAWGPRRQP